MPHGASRGRFAFSCSTLAAIQSLRTPAASLPIVAHVLRLLSRSRWLCPAVEKARHQAPPTPQTDARARDDGARQPCNGSMTFRRVPVKELKAEAAAPAAKPPAPVSTPPACHSPGSATTHNCTNPTRCATTSCQHHRQQPKLHRQQHRHRQQLPPPPPAAEPTPAESQSETSASEAPASASSSDSKKTEAPPRDQANRTGRFDKSPPCSKAKEKKGFGWLLNRTRESALSIARAALAACPPGVAPSRSVQEQVGAGQGIGSA